MYASLVSALQDFLVGPGNIFYDLAKGFQDLFLDGQGAGFLFSAIGQFWLQLANDITEFIFPFTGPTL